MNPCRHVWHIGVLFHAKSSLSRSVKEWSCYQWSPLFSGGKRSAAKYLALITSVSSRVKWSHSGVLSYMFIKTLQRERGRKDGGGRELYSVVVSTHIPAQRNAVSQLLKDGMLVFNQVSSSSVSSRVILTMGGFCLLL